MKNILSEINNRLHNEKKLTKDLEIEIIQNKHKKQKGKKKKMRASATYLYQTN